MCGLVGALEVLLLEQVVGHLHVCVVDVEDGFRVVGGGDVVEGAAGVELDAEFVDDICMILVVLGVRSCSFLYWP